MKVIYVKWRDSAMYHSQSEGDVDDYLVSEFESVGWYLGKNDEGDIIMFRDKIREEQRSLIVIPKENIIKTKILKLIN